MQETYDHKAVEAAAQAHWNETRCFEVREDDARPKFYCLSMLPYPSGALHMGHVRNYTIGDVVSRYQRMLGKNVMQPMGFDAFGLPAENAAIKHGIAPASWTYANMEHMRQQLRALGFAYDWSREVMTCTPQYYRHEQRFFTELMRQDKVYRRTQIVNWDPVEQTVLANEQVEDGRGWRSGALVEKREIPVWFFRVTDYAQELLDKLDELPGWPDSVKTMQRNWIGRSEGLEIDFAVPGQSAPLSVYTTRPDTLMGVSFISVAAEHPLALAAAARDPAVAAFIEECRRGGITAADLEKAEKKGVALGIHAIHPVSGQPVPVWAANFVLMAYGTGAVMAVPGHDQRDFEFASKYQLPILQVIAAPAGSSDVVDLAVAAYTDKGVCINSGEQMDGKDYRGAFDAVADFLESRSAARRKVNFRLRDWGVSRQRYWGCPIPVLYRENGDAIPVPADQLPVVLPEDVKFEGVASPIKKDPSFYEVTDAVSGEKLRRETDTFDTFVESSWYYARYCSPGAETMVDARANHWLPVDLYIGGIEHAVMHLMYFRYWHKLMRDAGYVHSDEPATNLLCQGMVVADTYFRPNPDGGKSWYNPADVDVQRDAKGRPVSAVLKSDGQPVVIGPVQKMSKSLNNGVDPQVLIDQYGADTVRLFSMFAAPPDQELEWSDAGVEGCARFVRRIWKAVFEHVSAGPAPSLDLGAMTAAEKTIRRQLHEAIAKVNRDIGERYKFNTAIAAVMEFMNALAKFQDSTANARAIRQEAWLAISRMLAPITPHLCHALWSLLGQTSALIDAAFPTPDDSALVRDLITLVVQVNGKLRGQVQVAPDASQADIEALALADSHVARFLEGVTIRKKVLVPGKLLNIVAN